MRPAQPDQPAVQRHRLGELRLVGARPRQRGARVLPVVAVQTPLGARPHHRDARQRHRQPDRYRHHALPRDVAEPRGVVGVERVHVLQPHPPREGRRERQVGGHEVVAAELARALQSQTEAAARGGARNPEPVPQRPGEVRVGHGAVPGIPGEVGGGIVGGLAEQDRVGVDLLHRAPHRLTHLGVQVEVAEAAGHVGDVDAPAVEGERRLQVARHHRVVAVDEAAPQLLRAPVELRQARHSQPARVGGLLVVQPQIERALRRLRVAVGRLEPFVRIAGVVRRQIADDPDAPGVRRLDQRDERLVAPEQRVDVVEGERVVAVVAAGGEDGRQVQQVHAERAQVIQVLFDAREVAAVELLRRVRAILVDLVVPLGGLGPLGQLGLGDRAGRGGAREAVGEHLIHDGLAGPGGRRGGGHQPEVVDVARLRHREPGGVQPADRPRLELEQEPVAVHRILDVQLRLPPARGVVLMHELRLGEARLTVGIRAGEHARHGLEGAGHPQSHAHRLAEGGRLGRDIER